MRKTNLQQLAKVWLIEDNLSEVLLTRALLEDEKVELDLVPMQDSKVILDLIGADDSKAFPDLILLDLNMPEISGLDLLQELRGNKTTQTIPAYIFSGSEEGRDKKRAISLGAAGYITKPISRMKIEDIAQNTTNLVTKYEDEKCILCVA